MKKNIEQKINYIKNIWYTREMNINQEIDNPWSFEGPLAHTHVCVWC